jgi:hypothetical protein
VVMGVLGGVLKLVSGGPPHFFWFLWSSWGRHWCWCRSGLGSWWRCSSGDWRIHWWDGYDHGGRSGSI